MQKGLGRLMGALACCAWSVWHPGAWQVAYLPIDGPGFPATTASLLFFATFRHYVASTYTPSKLAGRADAAAPCRAAGLKDERNSHFVACHATSLVHSAVLGAWSKPPTRNTSCCCHPLTGVPCSRLGPRPGVPAICIAVYLYLLPATDCPLEVLYLQSDAIRTHPPAHTLPCPPLTKLLLPWPAALQDLCSPCCCAAAAAAAAVPPLGRAWTRLTTQSPLLLLIAAQ